MIFAHTHARVLARTKTQTVRLMYAGDQLVDRLYTVTHGWRHTVAVVTAAGRVRWRVGGELAVQPERCHPAVCRVRVTSLAPVSDPTAVDEAWARAEGFATVAEYLAVWHRMHTKNPVQPCWAIGFELVCRVRQAVVSVLAATPGGLFVE